MRRSLLLVLTALSVIGAMPAVVVRADERPNVLFFLADDLGWRDLGCYGSTFYESPTLDRLAKEGMRFTNAYTAGTVCSPTRASIITGQTPARHGCNLPAGRSQPRAPQTNIWTASRARLSGALSNGH